MREPDLRGHVPALDAVRGVAILLVLLLHFSAYDPLPPPVLLADRVVEKVAGIGWIGVDLFFVLSGFLITGILYDAKGRRHCLRNFYARRVLRIFPVYYAALAVFVVLLPCLDPSHPGLRTIRDEGFWYWTYLTNVRVAQFGFPGFGALGHFWSLAIEEQFYLLWPFVVLGFGRRGLMRVCLACVAAAFACRLGLMLAGYGTAAYVLMPARMDTLAIGAALALLARGPEGLAPAARWARPAAALLGAAAAALALWRGGLVPLNPVVSTLGHTLIAALFGAVLVVAVTSPAGTVGGRFWTSRTLCFFGRYSYGLYVFHHPILFFGLGAALPLDRVPLVFGSLLLKKLTFMAAAMTASVVLALVSWHLYEKHFLELKRLFAADVARSGRAGEAHGRGPVSPASGRSRTAARPRGAVRSC